WHKERYRAVPKFAARRGEASLDKVDPQMLRLYRHSPKQTAADFTVVIVGSLKVWTRVRKSPAQKIKKINTFSTDSRSVPGSGTASPVMAGNCTASPKFWRQTM